MSVENESKSLFQRFRENPLLLIIGTVAGFVGQWVLGGLFASVVEYATFPMIQQRIETVRHAAVEMPCLTIGIAYQPVVAAVLDWNTRIAHEREAKRHLYSRWLSPQGWLQVQQIQMPCPRRSE